MDAAIDIIWIVTGDFAFSIWSTKLKPLYTSPPIVDIIISIGGEKVESIAEFRYQLYKHKPGEKVELEYVRGKKVKKVELTLTENKG